MKSDKQPELPFEKGSSSGRGKRLENTPMSGWVPQHRRAWLGTFGRILLFLIVGAMVVIPFTPLAARIKAAVTALLSHTPLEKIVVQERPVIHERIKEVIKEVPAPPPPLPSKFVARKDVDVATLFSGITIETKLETTEGNFASLEVGNPDAYKVKFALEVHVPKPNQTVPELARLNPHLPKMFPDLPLLLDKGKVSGFWHKLYENKVDGVQKSLTRLNRLLDRHNFFDCETILELQHPKSGRRALLIQSEMDVVADGSDGDRQSEMSGDIYNSDYYQPFTSYEWAKQGNTANPLLAKWANKRDSLKKDGARGMRASEVKAQIKHLEEEMSQMKSRSSLIGDKDPFIVISLLFKDYPRIMPQAPAMGDYCAVIWGDKIYPAICGDYGPSMKMGEASLLIAKKINAKATPDIRGEDDLKVTYLIFPGTAERPFGPPDLNKWHEKITAYMNELGGLGQGYSVYQWDEQFPKPNTPDAALIAQGDKKPDDPAAAAKTSSGDGAPPETVKKPDTATGSAATEPQSQSPSPDTAKNGNGKKAANANGSNGKKKNT